MSGKTGKSAPAQEKDDKGIIYAKPQDISSNIPLDKVLGVSKFFQDPENKVKIQFPAEESKFAWVNMSEYYHTAQVMRKGPVRALPYAVNPAIGQVTYRDKDGKV